MSDRYAPPSWLTGGQMPDLFSDMLDKLESIDKHLADAEEDAESMSKVKGLSASLPQNKTLSGFAARVIDEAEDDNDKPRPAFLHDIPKNINVTLGKGAFPTPNAPVPAFTTTPVQQANPVQSQTPSGSPSLSGNNAPQQGKAQAPVVNVPTVNVPAPAVTVVPPPLPTPVVVNQAQGQGTTTKPGSPQPQVTQQGGLPTPAVNPMTATFIPTGSSAGKATPVQPQQKPLTVVVNTPTIPLQGQQPPSQTYNARSAAPVMPGNPCPPGYRWDHVRGRCVPIATPTRRKSKTGSPPVPQQTPPQTQQPSFFSSLWDKLKQGLDVKDRKGEAKAKVHQARVDKSRARERVLDTRKGLADAKSRMNDAQQKLNRAMKTGKGLPQAKQNFQRQKASYDTAKADAKQAPLLFKDAANNLRAATKDYATQSGMAGKFGTASEVARKMGFEGTANQLGKMSAGAAGGAGAGMQAVKDIKEGLSQLINGHKFGDIVGGAAKAGTPIASAVAGPVGAMVIGPMGALAGAVAKSVEKLREWTESLHNSNMQFSEFSSAMAGVKARAEIRDMQLSMKRGDRRAEGAEEVAKLKDSIARMTAPIEDWWANKKAEFAKILRNTITDPIVRVIEGTEDSDNFDPTKWLDTMATQWIKEEASNWDNFGRPPRFPAGR